jgi:phosphatidylglycerophosphate synthase
MRKVSGVSLLVRVIATAGRAGVDSILIIWPDDVDATILRLCMASPLLKNMQFDRLAWPGTFDPRSADWAAIVERLEDQFLWLPWNWVTHRRSLASLSPTSAPPLTWECPVLLEKRAVLDPTGFRTGSGCQSDGVSITSSSAVRVAERFLVANSGKPLDGMYSKFNRRLCRPFVRLLAHTPVTPNGLTLGGLLVALFSGFLFARGSSVNYVGGALLFFLSGLFDEMDGMIARIKFRDSALGTWFEGFVDNITYLIVFAGITIGLQQQYGRWALEYGLALLVGCILSVVVVAVQRKLGTALDRPHEYAGKMNQLLEADSSNPVSRVARQIHIFIKKGVLIHYLLIFTVVGGLPLFLWLAAVGSNLTWIFGLYFTFRFFVRPSAKAGEQHIQKAA